MVMATIPALPASFDPALGGSPDGMTNTIFAASYGNGVYESTNGGASWSAIGGADLCHIRCRFEHRRLLCDRLARSLWSYANGEWTTVARMIRMMGMIFTRSDRSLQSERDCSPIWQLAT